MRSQALFVGSVIAAACVAVACSTTSSTSPGGGSGGHSDTITGSTTTTGGVYGSGGNYFFSPNPDTVAVGATVTFSVGSIPHSVHFISGPATPDSIPLMSNGSATRTFTVPGTYTIECFNHMFMGTIVVQ